MGQGEQTVPLAAVVPAAQTVKPSTATQAPEHELLPELATSPNRPAGHGVHDDVPASPY